VTIEIGQVEAIFRYPVKSMAGERLKDAKVGWHGIDGDRRLALRRMHAKAGSPWLTATKLPDLLHFTPLRRDGEKGDLVTHVRTPDGRELPVFGEELAAEIERRHKAPVEMMHLRQGIFDETCISVITADTIEEIGRLAGTDADTRRFRPNILVRLCQPAAFQEDEWVGGVLSFGDSEGPRVSVIMRDERCAMVNYHPDSGSAAPEVMKSIVRRNQNCAGVYATVTRRGALTTGQPVYWTHASDDE
jgi:uncharacterized protein YcbX